VVVLFRNGTLASWGAEDDDKEEQEEGVTNEQEGDSSVTQPPASLSKGRVVGVAGLVYGYYAALLDNGQLVTWGWDSYSEASPPRVVQGRKGAMAIAGGWYHFLGLWDGGSTVHAWGDNDNAQLEPLPRQLLDGSATVTALAAGGSHSLALLDSGEVVAWGRMANSAPLTTQPLLAMASSPGGASTPATVVQAVGGQSHSLALLSNGNVVAWGANKVGQLPPRAAVRRGDVVRVAAGDTHSLLLTSGGKVLQFGSSLPPPPPAVTDGSLNGKVADIAAGYDLSLVVLTNGTLLAWGDSECEELPTPAIMPAGVQGHVAQVAAGDDFIVAQLTDGRAAVWGCADAGYITQVRMALCDCLTFLTPAQA
jgi:alpha-tubulin suppressor-like RCC1 family protein